MTKTTVLLLCGLPVAACTTSMPPPGSAALGIADFRVTDTPARTTIVALDVDQHDVGTVDLVHGTIVLGDEYETDAGKQAQGRDLHVDFRGESFGWQTLGFDDTTQMPPLSANIQQITSLLADPHVRPYLDRWKIGWLARTDLTDAAGDETAYWEPYCTTYGGGGETVQQCNGYGATNVTCPLYSGNTPACNGLAEWNANSIHQAGSSQSTVTMCCGDSSNTTGNWAVKTCADSGTTSSCGNGSPNKCKSCGTPIAYSGGCTVGDVIYGGGAEPCVTLGDHGICSCNLTYTISTGCDGWIQNEEVGYMTETQCVAMDTPTCQGYGYSLTNCTLTY